jgi:hypothetical protein
MIIINRIQQAINKHKYNRAKKDIIYFLQLINITIPDIHNKSNASLKIEIKNS